MAKYGCAVSTVFVEETGLLSGSYWVAIKYLEEGTRKDPPMTVHKIKSTPKGSRHQVTYMYVGKAPTKKQLAAYEKRVLDVYLNRPTPGVVKGSNDFFKLKLR